MSLVTGIGGAGSVPEPTSSGHDSHGAQSGGDSSFAAALSGAINRSSAVLTQVASRTLLGAPDAWVPSETGLQRRHIPLSDAAHPRHDFQQVAMALRAYRQQLLASNIANADTPGYKAVDIDFQEALRNAQEAANVPEVSLAATSKGHLPGQGSGMQATVPLKYRVPSQGSVDGNTVEMDVERAKFAENTIMWRFAVDRVSGHFKHEIEMIQSLK